MGHLDQSGYRRSSAFDLLSLPMSSDEIHDSWSAGDDGALWSAAGGALGDDLLCF